MHRYKITVATQRAFIGVIGDYVITLHRWCAMSVVSRLRARSQKDCRECRDK